MAYPSSLRDHGIVRGTLRGSLVAKVEAQLRPYKLDKGSFTYNVITKGEGVSE